MPRVLSKEAVEEIDALCARYPSRLAAMLPALHVAQREAGKIDDDVEMDVAEALDVPPARVREATTFYTMFYQEDVGKYVIKICRNLACQLRGADRIMEKAKAVLGVDFGETTPDGKITLEHEECLASCGTGPMLWCNDNFVENLDEQKLETFLASLK